MFQEKEKDSDFKPIQVDLENLDSLEDILTDEKIVEDPSYSPVEEIEKEDALEAQKIKEEKNTQDRNREEKTGLKEETGETASAGSEKRRVKKGKNASGKHSPKKKKSKVRSILGKLVLGIFIIVLALAGTFAYSMWSEYSDTVSEEGKTVEVTIEKGATSKQIATLLKDKGLIRYKYAFLVKLSKSEYRGKLHYGTFELNDGMCVADIIKTLATTDGEPELKFTMPEGYTVAMTAAKLEKEGIMTASEFEDAVTAAAADFKYADELPDAEDTFYQLEGFLYPDTYYIEEDTTAEQLVDMMLDEFIKNYDETRIEEAEKLGMSMKDVVIKASIVEKETVLPEEDPMVAGVIENRLNKGMKLQMDSTVIYGETKGMYGVDRVKYSDLEYDSPYNTYIHEGLPAGAICSPSLTAIDGVLNYTHHQYLYFQTDAVKNDGSNLYFENYEDHAAASSTASAAASKHTTETAATTSGEDAAATTEKGTDKTAAKDAGTTASKNTKTTSTKKKTTSKKSDE